MTTYPLLAVDKLDTTTPAFRETLVRLALEKGLSPSLIAAVIAYESGFNPKARNPHSGALGLIQWMPKLFPDLYARLPALDATGQLPAVVEYFAGKNALTRLGSRATPTDYYLAVFLPGFIGQPKTTVLGVKGSNESLMLRGTSTGLSLGRMYEQNAGFDTKKNGLFTLADVGAKIENIVSAAQRRAPLQIPLPGTGAIPSPNTSPQKPPSKPAADSSSSSPSAPQLSSRIGSRRAILRENKPTALPELVPGSHGPAVELLQRLLVVTARPDREGVLSIDGEFGPSTELWLALHQQAMRLEPSGICSTATWESFIRSSSWPNSTVPTPTQPAPKGFR